MDVAEASPYRMSVEFDINEEVPFTMQDTEIALKVKVDKDPGFSDPIELLLGNKNRLFSLEPTVIQPEENEKTIYIKLNEQAKEKLKSRKGHPSWQMHIVGTVKGEVIQRGRRRFQNAKYREMTPIFVLRLKR